jgi:hypothetical protein
MKNKMKKDEILFDNPWVKMKKTQKGFIYAERKGIDSVAFILIDKEKKQIGVLEEYKDAIYKRLLTAFGGSIDKHQNDLKQLVIEEILEESGFQVEKNQVKKVAKIYCSNMMNQFVHLFVVFVDKNKQGKKTTTNPSELKSTVIWKPFNWDLKDCFDWKTITILFKINKILK